MKELRVPVAEEIVRELKAGDTVVVSGRIYTGRDKFHKYIADGGRMPVDFRGGALYHCGPVVVRANASASGKPEWTVRAAGPTTSVRENPYEPEFIEKSGVRLIIGKGGMDDRTLAAMRRFGCVYIQAVGGAGALYANAVKKVSGVSLLKEFGAAEAVWHFDVVGFRGVVAMDSRGVSLFDSVAAESRKVYGEILA